MICGNFGFDVCLYMSVCLLNGVYGVSLEGRDSFSSLKHQHSYRQPFQKTVILTKSVISLSGELSINSIKPLGPILDLPSPF